MQNKQPLSFVAFAINYSPRHDSLVEKQALLQFVDKAPEELGVVDAAQHQTVFNPQQMHSMLRWMVLDRDIVENGGFLGTMQDACEIQSQAGFPLVRRMQNQSTVEDVVIIVTNKCMRPHPKRQGEWWMAPEEIL